MSDLTVEKEIAEKAQNLFDVVGVASHGEGSLLILGLVTTPQRDLDDFFRGEAGSLRMRGFERHAQPRLDELIQFIKEQGLTAELSGRFGYPREDEGLNLKQQAVVTGLGNWGKNSLVLHPTFGPWLRFMAMRVDAPLALTGPGDDSHQENPLCEGCTACIDACPVGILEPYFIRGRDKCKGSSSLFPQPGKLVTCDQCLVVCPVGQ